MRWWRWRIWSARRACSQRSRAGSIPKSTSFPADGRRDAMTGNNPARGLFILRVVAAVTGGQLAAGFDVFHFGDSMRRGYEYNLTLIAASLCVAFGGPGSWALGGPKGTPEPARMA